VRVDQPFELAENILADEEQWSQSALQSLKDTGETTRLNLAKPLDVLIMYWTVSINQDGVHFYPDVYGRDKNLIEKLVKPL
jgi:murein L,D-transpeptidase YcbB/YkuD